MAAVGAKLKPQLQGHKFVIWARITARYSRHDEPGWYITSAYIKTSFRPIVVRTLPSDAKRVAYSSSDKEDIIFQVHTERNRVFAVPQLLSQKTFSSKNNPTPLLFTASV